jgi:hypothetical protein
MSGMPPQASSVPVDRPIKPVPREAPSGNHWHEAFPAGIRVEATVILAAKDGGKARALADAIDRCVKPGFTATDLSERRRADPRLDAFCQTLGPGWEKMYWDLRKLAFEQKVPGAAAELLTNVSGSSEHVSEAQKLEAWRQQARELLNGDGPRALFGIMLDADQASTGLSERERLILWGVTEEMRKVRVDEFGLGVIHLIMEKPDWHIRYPALHRLSELAKSQPLSELAKSQPLTEEEKARVRAIVAKIDQQRKLPLDRRP